MTTSLTHIVCHLCDRAVPVEFFASHKCAFPAVQHQERDHSVKCWRHGTSTWSWDARCERCVLEDQAQ